MLATTLCVWKHHDNHQNDSLPYRFDSSHHPPPQVAQPLRVLLGGIQGMAGAKAASETATPLAGQAASGWVR